MIHVFYGSTEFHLIVLIIKALVPGSNLEETLTSVRKALAIQAMKKMQEISLKNGNTSFSDKDIQTEIEAARKGMK